jgi:hypothetical protein
MSSKQRVRRQIFVLTPDEKKAVCCVLAMFCLGLATRHYRATHPRPPAPLTAKAQRAAKIEARNAAARSRSARAKSASLAAAATPAADDDD